MISYFFSKNKLLLTFSCILFHTSIVFAQCTGCTSNINTSTSSNITVGAGQTVCINAGVVCTGSVYLNGGTLCNKGTINKLRLNGGKGRLNNYGTVSSVEPNISLAGTVYIYNYASAIINFTNVTVNVSTADSLSFILYNESKVIFSSAFSINSKKLSINNGLVNPGDPSNLNSSVFSVGGNFTVDNGKLGLINSSTGRVTVEGTFSLLNGSDKTIVNTGEISVSGSIKIAGDGGATLTQLLNQGKIEIGSNFESTSSGGTVIVNNNAPGVSEATLNVTSNVILSSATSTLTNADRMTVTGNMTVSAGSYVNDNTLVLLGKLTNSGGKISNTYIVEADILANLSGTCTNTGFLKVVTSFTNTGIMQLGKQSSLYVNAYYNLSEGAVKGPALTAAERLANRHARIFIDNASQNTTVIDGDIYVYDRSLNCGTSLNGYGFDLISNSTSINANVKFVDVCTSGSGWLMCSSPDIVLTLEALSTERCPNDELTNIKTKFGLYECLLPYVKFTPITTGVSYTWQPGGMNTASVYVSPTVTTVYTVTTTFQTCTYVETFTVTVKEDCPEEIFGCCFSNYGAGVWIDKATTYLNVYCNLVNEVVKTGTLVQGGEFESKSGNLRVLLNWYHNGKNSLYIPGAGYLPPADIANYFPGPDYGTTSLFGADQKIKGNSSTYFNNLVLDGSGTKSLWINTYGVMSLVLNANVLSIRDHIFAMTNSTTTAIVGRTTGYASTGLQGYFSRRLGNAAVVSNQKYLFPLGAPASATSVYRYRPLVMKNNSTSQADEVSANFMNMSPSLVTDPVFQNAVVTITNNVNDQSPSVINVNKNYYYKIKNTVPPASTSNLSVKSYFLFSEGQFQSLAEWEKDPQQVKDWWGTTPGSTSSLSPSSDPGTYGLVYAEANGAFSFNHKAFALAKGGFYVNTSNFGNSTFNNGTLISLSSTALPGGSTPSGGGLNTSYGTGINSGNNGGGGSTAFAPSPVAGIYEMSITPPNTCSIAEKIKFVVDQSGVITPTTVQYGIGSTYYGELSEDVYSIDAINTGLILNSSPRELLKSCANSVTVTTTTGGDFVLTPTLVPSEMLQVKLPSAIPGYTISYGNITVYNGASFSIALTNAALAAGVNTIVPVTSFPAGVYRFEFLITASTVPPLSEVVKGQFIVK